MIVLSTLSKDNKYSLLLFFIKIYKRPKIPTTKPGVVIGQERESLKTGSTYITNIIIYLLQKISNSATKLRRPCSTFEWLPTPNPGLRWKVLRKYESLCQSRRC